MMMLAAYRFGGAAPSLKASLGTVPSIARVHLGLHFLPGTRSTGSSNSALFVGLFVCRLVLVRASRFPFGFDRLFLRTLSLCYLYVAAARLW